jgi:DNA-binding NtrC family response regulator/putative methionine-R-sulfoxide reductase with GAF domain
MMNALNLNEIASLQVSLSTLDEVVFFSKLCGFIHNSLNEHRVMIYKAFEDGSSELMSENGQAVKGEIIAKGQGLAGYVIRTKKAYYSNNVKRDPLLASSKHKNEVNAEIAIPINCDGQVLGTIHVQSLSENRNFGEGDVAQVLKLLGNIDQPIRNMKMFLAAKHLSEELMKKIQSKEVEAPVQKMQPHFHEVKDVEFVAGSKVMKDIIEFALKVAKSEAHLMIEGETGTGKELISRRIHASSSRAQAPFIVVDCTSKNESQLDADIFGVEGKAGLLEEAQNGTLFIEELAQLSLPLQAKLLKFLVKGEAHRVGSIQTYKSSARIVVATKKNIKAEVEAGKIREDLYFRLVNLSVKIPALRERREDIKVLAEYFLNHGKSKEDFKALTSGAIDMLMGYSFPGNVRELKSMVERLFIMADSRFIDESSLPDYLKEAPVAEVKVQEFSEMTLEELEKSHICKTLEHLKGNKTKTAKALGITVKTLYNKLHAYGMVAKDEMALQ